MSKYCNFLHGDLAPVFFRALAEPNRLLILSQLCQCKKPCTVSELCECCSVDQSVVSRHLSFMKQAGLLLSERVGKEVFYSVNFEEVSLTLRSLADYLDKCCKPKKERRKSK